MIQSEPLTTAAIEVLKHDHRRLQVLGWLVVVVLMPWGIQLWHCSPLTQLCTPREMDRLIFGGIWESEGERPASVLGA